MKVVDRALWGVAITPVVVMVTAWLTAAVSIGGWTILERVRRRAGRRAHGKADRP